MLPNNVNIAESHSGFMNDKMVILTNIRPVRISKIPANNGINVLRFENNNRNLFRGLPLNLPVCNCESLNDEVVFLG